MVTAVSVVVPVLGDYDLETPISQATGIEPYYAGLYGLAAAGVTVVILGYVGGRVLSNLVFSVGLRARGWSTAFGEVSQPRRAVGLVLTPGFRRRTAYCIVLSDIVRTLRTAHLRTPSLTTMARRLGMS